MNSDEGTVLTGFTTRVIVIWEVLRSFWSYTNAFIVKIPASSPASVKLSVKYQEYLRSIVSMLHQTLYQTATSSERVTKQDL